MLAGLNQSLGFAQSYGLNQDDILMFRSGIEEVTGHCERASLRGAKGGTEAPLRESTGHGNTLHQNMNLIRNWPDNPEFHKSDCL